jgi:hypothetical protein
MQLSVLPRPGWGEENFSKLNGLSPSTKVEEPYNVLDHALRKAAGVIARQQALTMLLDSLTAVEHWLDTPFWQAVGRQGGQDIQMAGQNLEELYGIPVDVFRVEESILADRLVMPPVPRRWRWVMNPGQTQFTQMWSRQLSV